MFTRQDSLKAIKTVKHFEQGISTLPQLALQK